MIGTSSQKPSAGSERLLLDRKASAHREPLLRTARPRLPPPDGSGIKDPLPRITCRTRRRGNCSISGVSGLRSQGVQGVA